MASPSSPLLPDNLISPELTISRAEKCAVCGNAAFGYNYGVQTCNACKMFFRRIEVEKIAYTCKSPFQCSLTRKSPNSKLPKCKSCRFQLCLSAGMRYIPPGRNIKFEVKVKDDDVNLLIANLMVLSRRARHKFFNFYTSEDPTLAEILENPRESKLIRKAENQKVANPDWSFLGIYTSIEFFLSLEFMDQLGIKDRTILMFNFAAKSMLFAGAKRTVDEKRDKIVTPDLEDVYPDSMYRILSREFLYRIRTILVARLIELKITDEEYVMITVILFSNSALNNLSPFAQTLISSRQRTYSNALLQYCLISYQQTGPARFSDLLSLCHVINKNFEDVHYLTVLVQCYMPNITLKKLFLDLLVNVQ